jgi:hypothetical protein
MLFVAVSWLRAQAQPASKGTPAENEAAVISDLKSIATAQAIFRQACCVDQNQNGVGEYYLLGELAGELALRPNASKKLGDVARSSEYDSSLRLCRDFKTRGSAGNGTASKSGYLFRIYLSNATPVNPKAEGDDKTLGGTPEKGGPAADSEAMRLQESTFTIYAWPAEPGRGNIAFVINEIGEVFATKMEKKRYCGNQGPAANAVYIDGGWCASQVVGGGQTFLKTRVSHARTSGSDGNQWEPVGR